jgi:hypothetical protein
VVLLVVVVVVVEEEELEEELDAELLAEDPELEEEDELETEVEEVEEEGEDAELVDVDVEAADEEDDAELVELVGGVFDVAKKIPIPARATITTIIRATTVLPTPTLLVRGLNSFFLDARSGLIHIYVYRGFLLAG